MRIKVTLSLFSLLCILFVACKPYDSNEVNRQLLQGEWELIETNNTNNSSNKKFNDSTNFDLKFEGKNCTEFWGDFQYKSEHIFDVDNFTLELYEKDSLVSKFNIITLTQDSLILGKINTWWKYKKNR